MFNEKERYKMVRAIKWVDEVCLILFFFIHLLELIDLKLRLNYRMA